MSRSKHSKVQVETDIQTEPLGFEAQFFDNWPEIFEAGQR